MTLVSAPATPPLTRYLIRKGDEMTPVAVGDIISITGAQDYSEVTTSDGHHLVSLSLADFEARLDPGASRRLPTSAAVRTTILHWQGEMPAPADAAAAATATLTVTATAAAQNAADKVSK